LVGARLGSPEGSGQCDPWDEKFHGFLLQTRQIGMDVNRRKSAVAALSVVSNSVLVVGKLAVGLLIGSVSVLSEAIHSGVDLVAALIALFAVRTSHKPADREHPFGHGKIENISGTIEALLIFLAAGWIIYEAARRLRNPQPLEAVGWGVAVMLVASLMNIIVSHQLFKVGRETDSVALEADAWHLRTDVYTSAGVMVSLGVMLIGGKLFPHANLHWLDPAAAIAVAILIIGAAWKLTIGAARDLMDVSLPAEESQWLREYVCRPRSSVRGCHNLRTRKSGPMRFVEFHLIVDGDLSVEDSHALTDVMTREIRERFPDSSVTIHVEPCDGRCRPECKDGCLLTEEQRLSRRTQ